MWLRKSRITVSFFSLTDHRGLNDKESRTQYTHVANLGCKNVYKVFAGGNHSWVVIDDVVPVRE